MLTQKTASARPKHGKELCLLSLDGGGVRGFSTLCIIEEMMRKIDPLNPPKPCDYFDMIGGTSTGGLIAVMLGRLKMTVEECREAYRELADEVFQPMNHLIAPAWTPFWRWRFNARFDTEALERSIKKIIFEQLKKVPGNENKPETELEDTLFQEDNPTCKVFVTATSAYLPDRTTILANYESSRFPRALFDCTKIWEACRATSAASTFFEPIDIGPDKQRFVDGATGANNPVVEVWSEAREAFKLGRELEDNVMCLVSLGTGIPTVEAFGETFVEVGRTLKAMATETETTAEKFLREHTNLDTEHRYFRFNVKTGLEKIGLENAAMRPQIVAATDRYVSSETVRKELEHCADTLRLRDWFRAIPFLLEAASSKHSAAMNFFTKTSSGAHRSPSYGQWITRFPQYKEWLSDPSRVGLFFIDEGTDHIDMAHEMVAHALHPISTVQGTVFIDLSSLGSMNQESCLTEVLQRILYQLLHLNPEGLWTLYGTLFRSGTIPAKALERFFNPNDNNPKDQDFRMDALLWALPDSTDNLYITFTGLEVIDPDTQIALLDLFLHQVAAFRVRPVKLLFCSKSPQPQSKLPIWAAIIDQEAQRKHCIDSLYFNEWQARRSLIDPPLEDTDEWVWHHKSFQSWLEKPSGVLWIKGKPGSGKSTIARVINDGLQIEDETLNAMLPRSNTKRVIAFSFFYSYKLPELATQHQFMLRSILYQILKEESSYFNHIQDIYHRIYARNDPPHWTLLDLKEALEKICTARSKNQESQKLCLILDGIDEAEDQDNEWHSSLTSEQGVLRWLTKLSCADENTRLKLIISCRPTTSITQSLGSFPKIVVEEHNKMAIEKIIEHGLKHIRTSMIQWIKSDSGSPVVETYDASDDMLKDVDVMINTLRRLLLPRASDTVQWVVVVLKELHSYIGEKGLYRPGIIEEMIESLPQGLEELYKELISRLQRRLNESDIQRARSMLEWACFTQRPLRLDEFQDALALAHVEEQNARSLQNCLDSHRMSFFQAGNWAPLERDISDTCGCLLEVVLPKSSQPREAKAMSKKRVSPDYVVQVIHHTAKEYLVRRLDSSHGLLLDPKHARASFSRSLFSYISLSLPLSSIDDDTEATKTPILDWKPTEYKRLAHMLDDRPLLLYIIQHFRQNHVDSSMLGAIQTYFQNLRLSPSEHGWGLLRYWVEPENLVPTNYDTSRSGDYQLRRTLFTDLRTRHNIRLGCCRDKPVEERFSHDLFLTACRFGYATAARLLLESPFQVYDQVKSDACIQCVRENIIPIVKVLLPEIDHITKQKVLTSGFLTAIEQGKPLTVQLLLDYGADPNYLTGDGYTSLHRAVYFNCIPVAEVLLKAGANIDYNGRLGTPLMFAVEQGNKEFVQFLIDQKANIHLKNDDGFGALYLALISDSKEDTNMISMLLHAGSHPLEREEHDRVLLDILRNRVRAHRAILSPLGEILESLGAMTLRSDTLTGVEAEQQE